MYFMYANLQSLYTIKVLIGATLNALLSRLSKDYMM